jgi:hypothetical protein
MAGNWLGTPPDWSVAHASGNAASMGAKRFVLTAPNKRRWEIVASDGNGLREAAKRLHALERCRLGEPLDAPVPTDVLPDGAREIQQRRCRDCTSVLRLERFELGHLTCRRCVGKRCVARPGERSVRRTEIGPCPVCLEPCPVLRLTPVPELGSACRSCAEDARKARAVAPTTVVLAKSAPEQAGPVAPASRDEDDAAWFEAAARASAAFGAPVPLPVAPVAPVRAVAPDAPPMPLRLPQMRDFGRLRALLQLVAAGITSAREIGEAMGAKAKGAARHASYYREAAEILGLLEVRRWTLTPLGERFLAASGADEQALLREAVAGATSLGPLAQAVLSAEAPELGAVVDAMAERIPGLARATLERRVKDTLSWRAALGLAPIGRVRARRPAPAPVVRTRLLQLELWERSANDPPHERSAPVVARGDFEQVAGAIG